MKQWLNQHRQALGLVLHRLQQRWLGALLICTVIGVTLAIPALIYMAIQQAHQALEDVTQDTQLSVFLKQDIAKQDISRLTETLSADEAVQALQFVSKADALKQMTARTGNQELIASLERNPLPDAFLVTPVAIDEQAVQALIERLRAHPEVDAVVADSAWIKRLNSLLSVGEQVVWIIGGLLSIAVTAIISNIIRMQVLMHKQEIEVSELFGASKRFVRRPFLYLGSLLGFLGGLCACAMVWAVTNLVNQAMTAFASEYQADVSILLVASDVFPWLLALATGLGWLAAYAAVALQAYRS